MNTTAATTGTATAMLMVAVLLFPANQILSVTIPQIKTAKYQQLQ